MTRWILNSIIVERQCRNHGCLKFHVAIEWEQQVVKCYQLAAPTVLSRHLTKQYFTEQLTPFCSGLSSRGAGAVHAMRWFHQVLINAGSNISNFKSQQSKSFVWRYWSMLHTSGHVTRDTAETPGLCLILFTWSETLPLNVQAWMSSSNQFDCKSMKKLTNNCAAHNDKIFWLSK